MKHLIRKLVIFYALTFYGSKLHCFKLSKNLKLIKKMKYLILHESIYFKEKKHFKSSYRFNNRKIAKKLLCVPYAHN